jgi:hypothetical protein
MTGPRIVTLDIETAPILGYFWALFKQNIGLDQIVEDWSILSVSWKWLGEKTIHYEDTFSRGVSKIRDDSHLLKTIHKVLDEADIVVSQNGKAFDIKKINARFLMAGMPPPSPYKQIDTKEEATKIARFTSNKLAWLAPILNGSEKDKHKEFPGFELWAECLKGNPKAWAVMRKYNPKDVEETEGVYLKMRPYIVGHPNVAAYNDAETMQCPKCSSDKMQRRGFERTQAGLYQRYKCGGCGGWSRTRYTENTTAKRAVLLTN